MAIVNITPDSFFDGGRWIADGRREANISVIVNQCLRWIEAGADILDLGGESTRPGSDAVSVDDELARVLPVVKRLRADDRTASVPLSIDTRHAEVARVCLAEGASIINDVSTLADPKMAGVVAEAGAGLVISHLRGTPRTMQSEISFDDLFSEVAKELEEAVVRAREAGVADTNIVVDPGVGFGKTAEQSTALVASSDYLRERLGLPVLIGASRKRFLGEITGKEVDERGPASVAAALVAARYGAAVVRVHDVEESVEALRVQAAIDGAYIQHVGVRRSAKE